MLSCEDRHFGGAKRLNGGIAGANLKVGHLLNSGHRLPPVEKEKTGIVIVGGGIAGLSAARELAKHRFRDVLLLELDKVAGGNSASGSNAVSAFPWGAHYVPIPGEEAVFVRELFEELGIIERYDRRGLPVYNDFYLCADPQERLLIHGRWQEGLVPQLGTSSKDRRQYDEFFAAMRQFKEARGNDGRRAFALPMELSSRDRKFLKYDSISMDRFLSDNGWDSTYLRWYVNYCCRDDYGCTMQEVSAWAGIHYFAARTGSAANADAQAVVTWPEGNGWIVRKMAGQLQDSVRCNACVLNIERAGDKLAVDYYDVQRAAAVRVLAQAVIYAAPRFTAFRAIKDFREKPPAYAGAFEYAPWMVANITMTGSPGGTGASLSWDNVRYGSDSLGYIVANHQNIAARRDKTVLTYYCPLTAGDPASQRRLAVNTPFETWAGRIVKDLSLMHPGIDSAITELNVWLWGHAMVRPAPGFIWGGPRLAAAAPHGKIYFAHSDISGLSLFEEAQYRGIMASRAALIGIKTA
jgi:phytoene dehydrogenase-like protein